MRLRHTTSLDTIWSAQNHLGRYLIESSLTMRRIVTFDRLNDPRSGFSMNWAQPACCARCTCCIWPFRLLWVGQKRCHLRLHNVPNKSVHQLAWCTTSGTIDEHRKIWNLMPTNRTKYSPRLALWSNTITASQWHYDPFKMTRKNRDSEECAFRGVDY